MVAVGMPQKIRVGGGEDDPPTLERPEDVPQALEHMGLRGSAVGQEVQNVVPRRVHPDHGWLAPYAC